MVDLPGVIACRLVNRRFSNLASTYSPRWKMLSSLVDQIIDTEEQQTLRK